MVDSLLRNIRQNGISSSECQYGHFAEESGDMRKDAVRTYGGQKNKERTEPKTSSKYSHLQGPNMGWTYVLW